MFIKKTHMIAVAFFVAATLASSNASAEPFNWIMNSAMKVGWIMNGDGIEWQFRKKSNGKWEIDGPSATGEVAKVISVGENVVEISGFPSDWDADGKFKFSRASGKCMLKSDHSSHELEWKC